MRTPSSGERYGSKHMIERQMLLWNVRHRAVVAGSSEVPAPRYRFVTLSRLVGSMADSIAHELSEHLGWHVFDKEIVDYISQNSRVRQTLVEQLDEKVQNLLQDTVQRFLSMAEGGSFGFEEYHEALLKTLDFVAARGDAILVGRGANFALRDRDGLHVRIVASPEVRALRLSQRWSIPVDEARRRMQAADQERRDFVRRHFKHDPEDLRYYDLVFNTDVISTRQVVCSILGALNLPPVTAEKKSRP